MGTIWLALVSLFLPISHSSQEIVEKQLYDSSLFGNYYQKAENQMKDMSLEEMVGQVFLARMNSSSVFYELDQYHPGGYVLFAPDFLEENKKSIREKIDSYQEKSKIPLVIAVDEEGGEVTRVSKFSSFRSSRFPSNQKLYQEGGFDLILQVEEEKIALLKEVGVNLNLAPVADVSLQEQDYMYKRTLGQNATVTSEYIQKIVKLYNEREFASCLKHFPGYGNNRDTHTGIAIDRRSYEHFLDEDFLPFQTGIKEQVPSILVSHNIVESMDHGLPASLSPKVHEILRKDLSFDGLILTDDLAMDAISKYTHSQNSAVSAILSGNDFVITSNLEEDYKAVFKAVSDKVIEKSILENAVRRILAFKYQYHIA